MTKNSRRIEPIIIYDNTNISSSLAPHLLSMSYTDVMSGEADDLSLSLADRQGLWRGEWLPELNARLDVTLRKTAWNDGEEDFHLGKFAIDEISVKGAPSEVEIKAVSIVDDGSNLTGENRTRSWEKATLRQIAQDIADAAGLELVYESEENPTLERTEQTEESDLAFLLKLTKDHGLALKVYDGQLVIFDEADYEKAEAKTTLRCPNPQNGKNDSRILSYSFSEKTRDVYAACRVTYTNPKTKETIEATFEDKTVKGKTFKVTQEVENAAAAEKLARKKLREKNAGRVTANISMVGSFAVYASEVVEIVGFGAFDGRYIIVRVSHSISGSGYTSSVELRRCLDGY